jgi:hypothetical protein
VALDVVGESIALSWLEPRLQLGRRFSLESTLQVIDIQFSTGVVSRSLGVRGELHLGPVRIAFSAILLCACPGQIRRDKCNGRA